LRVIGRLQAHSPDRGSVQKLLTAARRNLADAQVQSISKDNRFDAAYKAVQQCAMIGLWASGYRTSTSQPGHHQTALQCLTLTMGLPPSSVIVLDALRKQRNLSDYEGDPISDGALASCLEEASRLLVVTERWLRTENPLLAGDP
jgi:hypothetical protein